MVSTMYSQYDLAPSNVGLLVDRMILSNAAYTMVQPSFRSSATSCKKALHIILCTMRCRSGSYSTEQGLHNQRYSFSSNMSAWGLCEVVTSFIQFDTKSWTAQTTPTLSSQGTGTTGSERADNTAATRAVV